MVGLAENEVRDPPCRLAHPALSGLGVRQKKMPGQCDKNRLIVYIDGEALNVKELEMTESGMSEREEKVIDAAFSVFLRYGVRRTTMNDIAAEAGIVRQTLYNAFSNKDEVLRATIRLFAVRSLAAIEARLAEIESLDGKLDVLLDELVIKHYDLLTASPDADDIVSGFNEAGRDEIAAAAERYTSVAAEVLAPHEAAIAAAGLSVARLAEFFLLTAKGFKTSAKSRDQLIALLGSLKILVLNIIDES